MNIHYSQIFRYLKPLQMPNCKYKRQKQKFRFRHLLKKVKLTLEKVNLTFLKVSFTFLKISHPGPSLKSAF